MFDDGASLSETGEADLLPTLELLQSLLTQEASRPDALVGRFYVRAFSLHGLSRSGWLPLYSHIDAPAGVSAEDTVQLSTADLHGQLWSVLSGRASRHTSQVGHDVGGYWLQALDDGWLIDAPCAEQHVSIADGESGVSEASRWLDAGKNLCFVGDIGHAVGIMSTLLSASRVGAVIGPQARAGAQVRISGSSMDAKAKHLYHMLAPDRLGAWSLPLDDMRAVFSQCSAVIGYIDGRRLERVLMRYELEQSDGTLSVLAGIDVLVRVDEQGIVEMVGVELAEDGYLPKPLFQRDAYHPGHGHDDQASKQKIERVADASTSKVSMLESTSVVPTLSTSTASQPLSKHRIVSPISSDFPPEPIPAIPSLGDDAPPPGWELDLGAEQTQTQFVAEYSQVSSEDAELLAATDGIGPPPTPAGLETDPALKPDNPTFAAALARVRSKK